MLDFFKKFSMAAAVMCAIASMALAGCAAASATSSGSSSVNMQAPEVTSSSATAETAEVGEASSDGASFSFSNKLGKAIEGLSVKATETAEFGPDLLIGEEPIANGDTVMLNCPELIVPDADIQLNAMADFKLALADGAGYELHQVPVDDVSDAAVRLSGEIAYLEYTSVADGSPVSTLESEKAIAASNQPAEEQAVPEDVSGQVGQDDSDPSQAEEVLEQDAPYDEPDDESEDLELEPVDDSSAEEDVSVDDSAVGSGDEEACIDDIVLNF